MTPFRSFWMAGYECADQLNCFGHRVDLLTDTGHLNRLADDYADLYPFGIQTVREGIRWSQVERRPYQYDFSTVGRLLTTARQQGVQIVWDICHFGFPDDLTPLHPMFARRFAALCRAFILFVRDQQPTEPVVVTPINEVSFLAWLGGEARGTSPYCTGQGWPVKYALMRACIEGIAAMRAIDSTVQIMTTEPLINVVPPLPPTDTGVAEAARQHENQYQATDMLTGRLCPELGGSPDLLDVVGLNFYHNNQWVFDFRSYLPWANLDPDPRWRPLRALLAEVHNRYRKPLVMSETSHPGEDRPHWIRFIGTECGAAIRAGVPLLGICLYPIIDRPDWDFPDQWHKSGLWDATCPGQILQPGQVPGRVLVEEYAHALLNAQRLAEPMSERQQLDWRST